MPRPHRGHIQPDYKARRRRKKRTTSRVAVSKKSPEETLRAQTTSAAALAMPSAPTRPSISQKGKPKAPPREQLGRGLARGLGTAALAFPGRSKVGGIVKGALAGAAVGADIGTSITRYKRRKAGKKTQGTVSEKAAAQLAKAHKKDPSKTKRV